MKKKLEAELISIAHRILQMKNKSDLIQLHQEAQKLYEKLSVLRFVEEHLADAKPTIGYTEMEDKLAVIFDHDTSVEAAVPVATESTDVKPENKNEAIKEIISGISENANKQEVASPESKEDPGENERVEQTTEEPVAELASPEEVVSSVEAEATEEAKEEETADTEPEVEEPTETEEPDPSASDSNLQEAEQIKTEVKSDDLFKPAFEWGFEPKTEDTKSDEPKITPAQISFDDLLGQDYVDPVFVKPEEVETPIPAKVVTEDERRSAELAESNRRLADLREGKRPTETTEPIPSAANSNVIPISRNFSDTSNVISINKENLNDRMSKGITIGLNDRIAFMKHLFNNSSEDYNRVLSQLITFDTLGEAQNFIDTMVKPDYNNWEGKDEYEQRFMEIVEKKFS